MTNKILSYFRLYHSTPRPGGNFAGAPPYGVKSVSILWDIAHFFCLFLGIVLNPFVTAFQNHETASYEGKIISILAFSLIVAFAIFPAVFKKVTDTSNPKFIQLCMTFASGLGYQSLFMSGATLARIN